MRLVKRAICVFVVIFVIMACIPMSAFATGDVVEFTEAAKLGASIVDLYGMANNTNLAYDVASNQSALTVIENLYTEYSSNASDPYTLAAIGAAAAAAGAIAVIYDAVTGQGYIQLYQEQYISSLDGYWDYQLTDAGLFRDSLTGLFNWTLNEQDTVTPILVYNDSYMTINGNLLSSFDGASYNLTTYGNNAISTFYNLNHPAYCYRTVSGRNNQVYIVLDSSSLPFSYTRLYSSGQVNQVDNFNLTLSNFTLYGGSIYYYRLIGTNDTMVSDISYYNASSPTLTSPYDIFGAYNSNNIVVVSSGVSLTPYWGDPLEQPLEITIPDNVSPDYVPVPRRITTTMPVPEGVDIPLPEGVETPEYGVPYPITDPATLNAIVPELWDDLVADDVGLRDAPDPEPAPDPAPDPSEVFVPLLPVTLPSFNFNFAGIWHYVRDWVSSLGAWFTMVFSIWSNLPYAIVVPVYATAVIVIVLGVYKRFFM